MKKKTLEETVKSILNESSENWDRGYAQGVEDAYEDLEDLPTKYSNNQEFIEGYNTGYQAAVEESGGNKFYSR